jgi:hypothetical protein
MKRWRQGCGAMILSLALTVTASAQVKAAKGDHIDARDRLIRLFVSTERKHTGSRCNLNKILRQQPQFWQELHAVAQRLKTHPAWLLNVLACESLFDPKVRNPLPGQTASGLPQFIESTARGLGTTTAAVRRMSPVEQLRLFEKYLTPFRGRLNSLADVYTAVFRGTAIEGGDTVVVVDSGKERRIYALNRSLDINEDGWITKGELALAAFSIGRFLPARVQVARVKSARNGPASKTALENEEVSSVRFNQDSGHTTPASDDLNSETTRQTRSIYIRRENPR